ncbi:MAG: class I SAM-dependent methyltransferase [Pseudomonadota bacterium]
MAFTTPLFLPFINGDKECPQGRGLFLNAELPQGVDHSVWRDRLHCVQPWRDRYLTLRSAGYGVDSRRDEDAQNYPFALITVGKHRGETERDIAQAFRLIDDGGPIIIGGPKRAGAAAVKKWLSQSLETVETFSKHHWQVSIIRAGEGELPPARLQPDIDGFQTAPGMFSSEHIDEGSAFLAQHLPAANWGDLADFGCGWGFLSAEALRLGSANSVALIDAHAPSLAAASANINSLFPEAGVNAHWLDLLKEQPDERYDTIIMNPPFHTGSKTDADVGARFIAEASKSLKPKGVLYVVANQHLPYERTAAANFSRLDVLGSSNRYKVMRAVR